MPADRQNTNGKDPATQPLKQKFSVGHKIVKADNLQPVAVSSLQELELMVAAHSQPITQLIDPSEGVRTRQDYAQLPKSVRRDIKYAGYYLTSGESLTGGRKLQDMDHVGLALLDLDTGNFKVDELLVLLGRWEFHAWESISSMPGSRKWRVAFLLTNNLPAGYYLTCYRQWVESLDPRLQSHVDLAQGRPTQPALLPVRWEAGMRTLIFSNKGERLNLAQYMSDSQRTLDPKAQAFEVYQPPVADLTPARVRQVLTALDPDPEDVWIRVGWGLHHQYEGDREGLELWKEWAQRSAKFKADEHDYKWYRMAQNPSRSMVTWRSIEKMARDRLTQSAEARWEEIISQTDNADDLKLGVADGIISDKLLGAEEKQRLGSVLKKRAVELGDNHWSVAQWREHVTTRVTAPPDLPVPTEEEVAEQDPDQPVQIDRTVPLERQLKHWRNEWAYLAHLERFLNLETGMMYKPEAINSMLGRFLLNDKARPVMAPSAFLLNVLKVDVGHDCAYLPGQPDKAKRDGVVWFNTWSPTSLPAGWDTAKEKANGLHLTPRMRAGVFRFIRQVCYLLAPKDRRDFIRWLAWCVQNEGVKARWSPLIYSVQGTGKTLMAQAMGAVFGKRNATSVDGQELISSDYNGWCEGHAFVTIEELKVMGNERGSGGFAVSNKLKPMISNDEVTVRQKYIPTRTVPNVTNYMALTNHYHPISVESAAERRWFMCASELRQNTGQETFDFMYKRDGGEYFARLAELHTDEELILGLRRWLWHMDLKGWHTQNVAPKTRWLRDVAEISSEGSAHGRLPDLLSREWPGHDKQDGWFSLTALKDHVRTEGVDGDHDPTKVLGHTSTIATVIREHGYKKLTRVWIEGSWHQIYAHQSGWNSHGWVTALQKNTSGEKFDAVLGRRIRRKVREQTAQYKKETGELFSRVKE